MKNKMIGIDLLATLFYIGYMPLCPGTAASFFTAILIFLLPEVSVAYSLLVLTIAFFVGVFVANKICKATGLHDPAEVVFDEFVGMWLSLIGLPRIGWLYVLAFVLFRFFDVVKIFPINKVEKLSGGWGVMLDDLFAAVFVILSVNFLRFFIGL